MIEPIRGREPPGRVRFTWQIHPDRTPPRGGGYRPARYSSGPDSPWAAISAGTEPTSISSP